MAHPNNGQKWRCTHCTFENLAVMEYCEMCRTNPTQEHQREGPNALVQLQVNQKQLKHDDRLYKVYYNGQLMIAVPSGWIFWFAAFMIMRILLNVILAIWSTFFPHYQVIYMMWWIMCFVLVLIILRVIMCCKHCYEKKYDPQPITKTPFYLLLFLFTMFCTVMSCVVVIAINRSDINHISQIVTDHTLWLHALQTTADNLVYAVDNLQYAVQGLDKKFTDLSKDLNETYTKLLDEKAEARKFDELASKMWEGFGLISITRQHFGLGCFVKGTWIQIDPWGKVKKIEDLNEFDMIFNPDLEQMMGIKRIHAGPEEDGFIYEFITRDAFNVSVTKTHAMKICHDIKGESYAISKMVCENVAAPEVYEGNMTKTINGYQEIIQINKIPANNVTVYNVMLDMDPYEPTNQRTIIANDVHTFDLFAQALNEI